MLDENTHGSRERKVIRVDQLVYDESDAIVYCACGCGVSLAHRHGTCKWATRKCMRRANPESPRDRKARYVPHPRPLSQSPKAIALRDLRARKKAGTYEPRPLSQTPCAIRRRAQRARARAKAVAS